MVHPWDVSILDGAYAAQLNSNLTIEGNITINGTASNNSGKMAVIASGTYTGDGTVNRAMPHGMGVAPKLVMFNRRASGGVYHMVEGVVLNYTHQAVGTVQFNLTAADATNFYVGNATDYNQSGNGSTTVYDWVAIG